MPAASSGLEGRLGYRFRDPALLDLALTHGSASPDRSSNQRLEFLGDAVLELVVCEALYRHNPDGSEGELTEAKAHYVNNSHLADVARSLGLGLYLRLGKGACRNAEGIRSRLLSDVLEAVIGAVYLDGGLEAAASVVERHVAKSFAISDESRSGRRSSKTVLQEWLQAHGRLVPEYAVLAETGPSHDRTYRIEARCGDTSGVGEATTKKTAEERAAADALRHLRGPERPSRGVTGKPAGGRLTAMVAAVGLTVLGSLHVASAGVTPEASRSAAQKFQRLVEGGFESGSTIEVSDDEMNSFLQFDAASTIPEGVENLDLSFREGGAVIRARVDLERAGASLETISPFMRLLMRGTRSVTVDADYSARDGYAVVDLKSITVEGVELSGALLEWFVESLAPPEVRPYVMGERIAIEGGVSEVRLETGRAVIVVE